MEKEILWDKYLSEQFDRAEYEALDIFLELLYYIDENKIPNKMSTELYCDEKLWSWLSSREQIRLRDIKRELSIKIERAKKIDDQVYKDDINNVGVLKDKKKLVLYFNGNDIFHISSIDDVERTLGVPVLALVVEDEKLTYAKRKVKKKVGFRNEHSN